MKKKILLSIALGSLLAVSAVAVQESNPLVLNGKTVLTKHPMDVRFLSQ